MKDGLREYRQDFALAILLRGCRPMSAAEVAEHIAVLGQMEGHPASCWRDADPITMAGHLRALETKSLVVKSGVRQDTRAGRDVPMWKPVAEYQHTAPLPLPPETSEAKAAPAMPRPADPNPYADLTRSQLYALLQVHDQISGVCQRFMRDMEDLSEKARRQLNAAGLAVPE